MNTDSTDGIFQVTFDIDEILGEYPISHLPDELREKIAEPPVVIDLSIAPEETNDIETIVDAAAPSESSGNGQNIAAQTADAVTPAEEAATTS